ncbi:beta galactosidase jelly roll domain-containing protein [Candidatus Bathyarchaeota archaeon]|nr:beta galactosidase jelly roll domain-containing protein [Candidatus Bathyarchaeota archaeon]MBS7617340.1 beta galactosidase jelly roll domain-containing protein [Candidatus Bathyarchaeota archaeon]
MHLSKRLKLEATSVMLLSFALGFYSPFLNELKVGCSSLSIEYLQPTLTISSVGGLPVAYQNGVPFPSFEIQESRPYLDLGGIWKAYYEGEGNNLWSLFRRTPDVLSRLEAYGFHTLEFNDSSWEDERIPSSNNVRGGKHEGYQGVVWYRRQFSIPDGFKGMYVRLVFQGCNYVADVWVNEAYLGYHEGGFTPFVFDVTGKLNYGGVNLITVRVHNVAWDTTNIIVPYRRCDWWNYGGIYREIYLEFLPMVHIVRVDATPFKMELTYGFNVRVTVYNSGDDPVNVMLKVRVFEAEVSEDNVLNPCPSRLMKDESSHVAEDVKAITVESKSVNLTEFTLRVPSPKLWSPDNVNLYIVEAELESTVGIDRFSTQTGLRFIGKSSTGILLNGKPIFLKGLARHEDYPGSGRTLKPEEIFRDLKLIKDAGANWIRTAHYPNHPLTYIYADRLGLMVWEEIPVYWFDDEAYRVQLERRIAKQMLLEMVLRDYNRPSIIFWGLGNEGSGYDNRVKFLKDLSEALKLIDDHRLKSQAHIWNPWDTSWIDGGLDIPGFNLYFGVFYGSLNDLEYALDMFHQLNRETAILVTEFGLWSGGGVGEERQARYFEEAWVKISSKPYVAGVCWWTAFDYDSMIVFNTFGAVDWSRSNTKLLYKAIGEKYRGCRIVIESNEFLRDFSVSLALAFTTTLILSVAFHLKFRMQLRENGSIYLLIAGVYLLLSVVSLSLAILSFLASAWIRQLAIIAAVFLAIGALGLILSLLILLGRIRRRKARTNNSL